MVSILLATHGDFAEGIFMTGSMLFGEQENVAAVTLQPSEGPDDLRAKMLQAIDGFESKDEVLILVDLWGGTPFNQANFIINGHEDKWAIVAGLNAPMLITAYANRDDCETAHELAASILEDSRDGIKIYPKELEPADTTKAAAAPAAGPVGAIPPGTVLGDGHIKIKHARVDTRLLHGQVATNWSKAIAPDRIIVVSDNVSHDALRKQLIIEAAPPGIKAHVVPMKKMLEVVKDVRFGDTTAFLLFETPQDALEAIKGGVDIKSLNIGSMAHSQGKVAVNKVLSLDAKDVECFEELKKLGVKFDVRKVPADAPENMDKLIQIAKDGLGIK
jgi:PTS system mannose-specific IIB component